MGEYKSTWTRGGWCYNTDAAMTLTMREWGAAQQAPALIQSLEITVVEREGRDSGRREGGRRWGGDDGLGWSGVWRRRGG